MDDESTRPACVKPVRSYTHVHTRWKSIMSLNLLVSTKIIGQQKIDKNFTVWLENSPLRRKWICLLVGGAVGGVVSNIKINRAPCVQDKKLNI